MSEWILSRAPNSASIGLYNASVTLKMHKSTRVMLIHFFLHPQRRLSVLSPIRRWHSLIAFGSQQPITGERMRRTQLPIRLFLFHVSTFMTSRSHRLIGMNYTMVRKEQSPLSKSTKCLATTSCGLFQQLRHTTSTRRTNAVNLSWRAEREKRSPRCA